MCKPIVTAAFSLSVACRAQPNQPGCDAVAAKVVSLSRAQVTQASVSATIRDQVIQQLPPLARALQAACEHHAWDVHVRRCLFNASDLPAMMACRQTMTDAQRMNLP